MTYLVIYNTHAGANKTPVKYPNGGGYTSVEHLQKEQQRRNRDTCTAGWNKHCRKHGWDYKTVRPVPDGVAIFKHSVLSKYKRELIQIVVLEGV
jgi:hypothetical protein